MSHAATRPPKHPPPWFVHTAWRVHRALYRVSGGRFLWTTSNRRGWGSLQLTTIGRKSGQERSVIVGYLEDGTMVVVEDGLKFRGKPVRVLVVNNVQTNVGRMIFAKPAQVA